MVPSDSRKTNFVVDQSLVVRGSIATPLIQVDELVVHKKLDIDDLSLGQLTVNTITGQTINATTVNVGEENVTTLNVNNIIGNDATFQTVHAQLVDSKTVEAITTNSTNVNGSHINGAHVNGTQVNGITGNFTTLNAITGNIETLNATNANITNETIGSLTTTNFTATNATIGTASVGVLTSTHINVTDTTNQLTLGTGQTVTLNAPTPAASRTYTAPDVLANADFVMTQGTQTIAGTKTFSGSILLATTGGTPANLNYYSETTQSPFALTCTAFGVSPQNTTVQYVRIGKNVTMYFTGFSTAGGGSGPGNMISSTLVPAEYRPPSTFRNLTTVENSGPPATTIGTFQLTAAGVVTFTRASGVTTTEQTFVTAGTLGVQTFSASWVVA